MTTWFGKNIRWITHVGALTPLALLLFDALTGTLGANPIQEITFRTGLPALVLLIFSLACTPLNSVFRFRPALKVRRTLGLYGFFYVGLHGLVFLVLDYWLDLEQIVRVITEKRYQLVGFAAFLLLFPLVLTSTRGWQRRLGKDWKRLHRLVYLAAPLGVMHFVWLVKSDIRQPLAWGALVVVLLALRLRPVKRAVASVRRRLRARRTPSAHAADLRRQASPVNNRN